MFGLCQWMVICGVVGRGEQTVYPLNQGVETHKLDQQRAHPEQQRALPYHTPVGGRQPPIPLGAPPQDAPPTKAHRVPAGGAPTVGRSVRRGRDATHLVLPHIPPATAERRRRPSRPGSRRTT